MASAPLVGEQYEIAMNVPKAFQKLMARLTSTMAEADELRAGTLDRICHGRIEAGPQ